MFRTRKKGDVIAIKGGTQKLQDFFTKQKIPSHLRDSIYLLVKRGGNDIIWVVGDGISRISEKYKVCDTTNFIMEVSAPRGNNYER